jgi:hypothetical protein
VALLNCIIRGHLQLRWCSRRGGLYPAPLFHMDSMWNPYGIRVVPHGICPFHMEYVLAEISPILVISFHLYSMWIPCGFHVDSTIPHGISTRNPYGMFHMNSILFPCGFHVERWIPCGFHVDSMWKDGFHVDSMWIPCGKMDSMWNPHGIPNNPY